SLSSDQLRFQVLTKQIGLEYEEALHAIGRRRGGWLKHRNLSRQERFHLAHVYVSRGLTEAEAKRVADFPLHSKDHPNHRQASATGWMPAKQAFDLPSPGRSRKG